MKKVTVLLFGILLVSQLQAELFTQLDTVNIADNLTKNTGGIGGLIAGVDVDGDGKTEMYMVNDNWNDLAEELVPRIYKYEKVGAEEWELVWQAVPPTALVEAQNTWPTLSLADLDKDGKQELVWGIVNNSSANPARIVVYEHAGGDNFGVLNGSVWEPNSSWSIADVDGKNIRPINWKIADIDDDGVDEILFASRKADYRIAIISVDDIPDAGGGSETWTLEYKLDGSGTEVYTGDNKWDVAVLGNNAYFFDEVEISKISWNGSAYIYTALSPLPGGLSQDAVQVCDIDGNSTLEMITGEYTYGDGTHHLWLLEEVADTLKRTALFDVNGIDMLNGGRIVGGATGDIDADGNMDFVFGSYNSGPPNGMLFRLEFQGGAIDVAASWELSIIDSAYAYVDFANGGMWNVIEIANVDDDIGLEVLYTSSISIPYSVEYASVRISAPVIILDSPNTDPIVSIDRVVAVPEQYILHQNFPNPFNPSTSISFQIPQANRVKLVIYDIVGREVVSLIDNQLQPGSHSVIWNGKDKNGYMVSTGVYIYQLQADGITKTKKMTFMK